MAAVHEQVGHLDPGGESLLGLRPGHRGPGRQVRRTPADLAVEQVGARVEVGRDPHVDHEHVGADLAGEHVHRRPAGAEVGHHRGGDLLRPGAHALGVHPVVAGEHRDDGAHERTRRAGALDAAQGEGGVLEDAQRARGLGELGLPQAGVGDRGGVRGDDGGDGPAEQAAVGGGGAHVPHSPGRVRVPGTRPQSGLGCENAHHRR